MSINQVNSPNAWLLTWEGTSGPALLPDKKIVAILSARRSPSFVEDIVDVLYCRSVYSAYEMAFMINRRSEREQSYKHIHSSLSRIYFGRNLWIFARVVTQLIVERHEAQNTELIRWTELAEYGNAHDGSGVVELLPSRDCQLARSVKSLSFDIYND